MDGPQMALNAVSWRLICVDRWVSERAPPWPMEWQAAQLADLRDSDALMRCRSC